MPELPEVETVVRQLAPELADRTITSAWASPLMAESCLGPTNQPNQRRYRTRQAVDALVKQVAQQPLGPLRRHGKWMFLPVGPTHHLAIHLGMTGQLQVVDPAGPLARHTHLRLSLDNHRELRLCDPRRFGELVLVDAQAWPTRFGPDRLGPDALTVRSQALAKACQSRQRIKAVLLNQKKLAGVGNIYADESLFAARVHPAWPAQDLDASQVSALAQAVRKILRTALAHRGTTLRDYRDGKGEKGGFQHQLRVHGQAGQQCRRCQQLVQLSRTILTGRASYWCPRCQPAPSHVAF